MSKNSKRKPEQEEEDVVLQRAEEGDEIKDADTEDILALKDRAEHLEKELQESRKKGEEFFDRLQRLSAEFDNYKKRTAREKEAMYVDITADNLKLILPVLDNFERALLVQDCDDAAELKKGLDMVYKGFIETLGKMGVETIETVGSQFDPNFHNAVMHIEDDDYGANEIVEELQKGYRIKDKIIRYSYVKVAN